MDADYLRVAGYAGGLAATLILACYLTPARWWHRPTLRNLGIVALGTWGIGSTLLQSLGGTVPAQAAATPAAPATAPAAAAPPPAIKPFRVHRALNLRSSPGTSAERLTVVPAGSLLTPTGIRDGDWWQVRTEIDGKTQTAWASSLWLRRQGE